MHFTRVRAALLAVLKQDHPTFDVSRIPDIPNVQRRMLDDLLIASNTNWPDEVMSLIDQVYERTDRVTPWTDISKRLVFHGNTELAVWKGDITSLQIDAIVNAANDAGLGCFVPEHRCIDNTIHRAAGPRLRKACRAAMEERGYPLKAGTPPIVTPAFYLPCNFVIHVTGPQIGKNRRVTHTDRELLASAYRESLNACVTTGIRSIAFCAISTGLFGFPKVDAATVALETVLQWLREHPGQLESVVFDVFSEPEEALYREKLDYLVQNSEMKFGISSPTSTQSIREKTLSVAKRWIDEADAVLICAGAGMSVKDGEMVYVNPQDFARFYPWFLKWGYKTSYEVMGLGSDPRVPQTAKWAIWAKHMHLQRWEFEPNEGYTVLLNMVKDKDYFVLSSNVDACFERSGFTKDRIYTPQGEWTHYQCKNACRNDSVFASRPMLDTVVPHINENGFIPEALIPKCRNCGGDVFGNVRGDGNFLHGLYDEQNYALRRWMKMNVDSNRTVAIVEVGAGFNTPIVTRFPTESFARQLGERGRFIRINPSDFEVPSDLKKAISIDEGWQVLKDIYGQVITPGRAKDSDIDAVMAHQSLQGMTVPYEQTVRFTRSLGHFDWNIFLNQLKD